MDRAIKQFSNGSLRNETNQLGTNGYRFQLEPSIAAVSSERPNPIALRDARHPVQDFWVYDGAYPGVTDRGSIATDRDQILPNKRITEQDAVEWQRVGSKKGWMFNGNPQSNYGFQGEDVPTHTSDGFVDQIKKRRWQMLSRSAQKQGLATREMPAIDLENNARGSGVSGPGSGSGGMSGGYKEVDPNRHNRLPIPMSKYNWTGTRLVGTGREDQGAQHGAGGFRAGYNSIYPDRPSFQERKFIGTSSRVS